MMRRTIGVLLAALLVFSGFGAVAAEKEKISAAYLYVAVNGSDENPGSQEAPFATIAAAVKAARSIDGTVVINLREGDYRMTDTVALDSEDHDLVIRAYPGEKVALNGGVSLPYGDFKTVTDTEITNRIVDRDARDKIKAVSLPDYGVTDYGEMKINGFLSSDEIGYASTLSYQDKLLTIAEYPNGREYLYTAKILEDGRNGDKVKGRLKEIRYQLEGSQRYKKWTKAEDMWAFAFICHDWADATVPASIDVNTGVVTSYTSDGYYAMSNRRVKFMNLLEELDVPGEWYLDRNTGMLYLYAPEGIKAGDSLTFTSYNKPFFSINGAKNVTFEGLRMAGTRARAIDVKNADGIVVDFCELTNIGDCAVYFNRCTNSGVTNSSLHDLGSWGVNLYDCGDKKTLTAGNCFVTNNEIKTFSQYKRTYSPAIHLNNDVGNTVAHNEIHDAPHFAIRYDSNDDVIEYNEFYDVCQDTADCGAVYTGRYWNTWGNEVRYNYFHDMSMIDTTTGMKVWALYLDDMHSQTNVHGNVFYKVQYVALMGGGRNNTFINNLMIDCDNPLRFDSRGMTWDLKGVTNNTNAVDWHTEVWAKKYPELMNLNEDEPGVPKYNVLKDNVLYNTPDFNLDEAVITNGTVENNIRVTDKKVFKDYAGKNFALADGSAVYEKLPDFEKIAFDEMGRTDVTYQDRYQDNGTGPQGGAAAQTITLVIGSNQLKRGDETVTLDVPAQTINDRTMVPLRAIFEALGATVDWEEATQTVTSTKGGLTVKLTIGSNQLYKGDEAITLDVPAQVVNDRTLVPVRAISESFGCKVDWTEETQTVTITVK